MTAVLARGDFVRVADVIAAIPDLARRGCARRIQRRFGCCYSTAQKLRDLARDRVETDRLMKVHHLSRNEAETLLASIKESRA